MKTTDLIQTIQSADPDVFAASVAHWDRLAKPLGSLGILEEDISRIAAIKGHSEFTLDKRVLLVFCADNGVIVQGVSQSDSSVTEAVAAALGQGTSTVNYMANTAGCEVMPVDIGMASEKTPENVLPMRINRGTQDITIAPAMTLEECEKAILAGYELAQKLSAEKTDIILLGEMGIGNTTTSAAVASVLLFEKPEIMTGRGAGLSGEGLKRKCAVIQKAISVNAPDPNDPIDILRKLGGFDLAAMCGVCFGAAASGTPVLLDGVITNTAALLAVRMCPAVKDTLFASHVSTEPAAQRLLDALDLKPLICAGLHLGEGSGAMLALSLLDQAMAVYNSGHTFGHLGIDAYTHQDP